MCIVFSLLRAPTTRYLDYCVSVTHPDAVKLFRPIIDHLYIGHQMTVSCQSDESFSKLETDYVSL